MSNQTGEKFIFTDPNTDLSKLVVYENAYKIAISTGVISLICCALNIAVLAHPTLKDPLYKCIMVISAVDFFYLLLVIVGSILEVDCMPAAYLCSANGQCVVTWFTHFNFSYLTSCLAIFSILSEIFLTTQRLFLIKNIKHLTNLTWKHVSPVIGLISLIYYVPV
jgi:hypothetical protein